MGRIFVKLAAVFLSILLIFVLVLSAVFLWFYREQTIDNARGQLYKKAELIADSMQTFLEDTENQTEKMKNRGEQKGGQGNGYGAYIRYLEEMAMTDVWIVDAAGNLLTTHHGEQSSSKPLTDEISSLLTAIRNGETVEFEQTISGKIPEIYVGRKILSTNGDMAGAVLLHEPVEGISTVIGQGIRVLLAGVATASVLGLGLSLLLAYWITRPLRQMERAAMQMAEGKYTVRTGIARRDEIGHLAGSLDTLAYNLEEAKKEREALDAMKNDFIANVSHELRTPVAVLRGSVEQLKDGMIAEGEETEAYYQAMYDESCHLEHIVNDLLDLSKLQSTAFALKMENMVLQDVLEDALRFIRPAVLKKAITIQTDYPEDVCAFMGDYQRLRQLFLILLDNAVKFSDENGMVEVHLKTEDARYRLEIINSGETIPADKLDTIFERFNKSNSAKNNKGTGLGLPIARQIVLRHSGQIRAVKKKDQTCFCVDLPK